MEANKEDITGEILQGLKYFDLCFFYVFCKFLPTNKIKYLWRIFDVLRLSIHPLFLLNTGIWLILEAFGLDIASNQMKLSYLIIFFGAIYQSLCKYSVMLLYKEEFNKIREFMEELRDSLKQDNLTSKMRKLHLPKVLRFILYFIRIYVYICWLATILVSSSNAYMTNFSSPLMYKIPFFNRWINLLVQMITYVNLNMVALGGDGVLVIMVGYLAGELRAIAGLASLLGNKQDGKALLENIYLMHVRAHQILNELRRISWQLSLHIILSISIMLCLNLYMTRYLSLSLISVAGVSCIVFQLIIICFIGQMLLDSTKGVAEALWESNWYDLNIEDQKTFLFILRLAQIPKGISASDLTIISANTLAQVLKTCLSFIACLYTVIN